MKLLYPTKFPYITQHYGNKSSLYLTAHNGTDFRVKNDPAREVLAAADGEVVRVHSGVHDFFYYSGGRWLRSSYYGKGSYYGNEISIKHEQDGKVFFTRYGHNEKTFVNVGDKVKAGQKIAQGGNTGYSQGAHLHFMTQWVLDSARHTFNPEPFFVPELPEPEFLSEDTESAWKWAEENGIISEQSKLESVVTDERLMTFLKRFHDKFLT